MRHKMKNPATFKMYKAFLDECVIDYNERVKDHNTRNPAPTPRPAPVLRPRPSPIVGRWEGWQDGQRYYWQFDADSTFRTNNIPDPKLTSGRYSLNGGRLIISFSTGPQIPMSVSIERDVLHMALGGSGISVTFRRS